MKLFNSFISRYIILTFIFILNINFHVYSANIVKIKDPIENGEPIKALLILDAKNKKILNYHNAYTKVFPASLTKMMTIYIAFDEIQKGNISFDSLMKVSERASSVEAMKLYLRSGSSISVKDAILALIIVSANDAATVLAEHIGGTEEKFARLMTNKAKELGMRDTIFKNASGLPNKLQVTTAFDMAKLGIALSRDFPEYYKLFSRTNFTYRGTYYHTFNSLTAKYKSVNGIKTGYTRASGYNLVTSAARNNNEVVGVIIGAPSIAARNKEMLTLITKALNRKA